MRMHTNGVFLTCSFVANVLHVLLSFPLTAFFFFFPNLLKRHACNKSNNNNVCYVVTNKTKKKLHSSKNKIRPSMICFIII